MTQPPQGKPLSIDLSNETKHHTSGAGKRWSAADWFIFLGIPTLLALVGAGLLFMWLRGAPQVEAGGVRIPQAEPQRVVTQPATPVTATAVSTPAASKTASLPVASVPTGGSNAVASQVPTSTHDWPCFRNADRTNISPETGLARTWPAGGPQRLWSIKLGEGHAGAAVHKGRVYILDYDMAAKQDVLRCLSLADGKQLWSQGYSANLPRNHGMSRTVPAIQGNYVVTLGPLGMVMCCDINSGKVVWKHDLVAEFGTKIPDWYAGECPLIANNNAIIATGGKALMIAIHLPTGKITWTTPNPRGWQMTHCSITPTSYAGKRLYIYPFTGGVAAVNATNGKLLWDTTEWTVNTANIPAPIAIGDGRIFVCGGYNSGAMMFKMNSSGTGVSDVFRLAPNVFQSHQQTPILYKGHLYGVRVPGDLVCLDLNGKVLWSSGNANRYGIGPYLLADGMLYVLSDNGTLSLVEASTSGFKLLSSAKVLSGPDAWAPMALVDGKLLLRDMTTMVCLKVSR